MSDMVIYTRMFEVLNWLGPHCARFPAVHRFGAVQRLQAAAFDACEAMHIAGASRGVQRSEALQRADGHLNLLRMYLRLAHDWHWLNSGQYAHISKMVAEVGRLLGGWMKQSKAV